MKLKNIFTSILICGTVLTACDKLEVHPPDLLDPDEAIKSEQDVKDLLNGAYTVLRDDGFMGGQVQVTSELMADKVNGAVLTGDWYNIFTFNTSGIGTVAPQYTKPYAVIQRVNQTLEKLELVTSSQSAKDNIEGQARFMRAFSYFEMIKLFAQPWGYTTNNDHLGLVIKTQSDLETALPRATVKEVYDFIIADLNVAQNLLTPTNENYPGALAAKAVLARVYFQMNKFDSAYKYSDQVIASGQFPFDNTAAFITNRYNVVKTPEAILWVVYEPNWQGSFGRLYGNVTQSMGFGITKAAYDEGTFNTNDVRKAWYKDSLLAATQAHIYSVRKYPILFVQPLIHVTEMKFVRAESAAELGQHLDVAIADINDITNRAYNNTMAALPGGASAATIISRVRNERMLDMVLESGDRLQQIKRIGAKGEASTSRTAPWNCKGMVLQFPATETNVNDNFIQNPIGPCL